MCLSATAFQLRCERTVKPSLGVLDALRLPMAAGEAGFAAALHELFSAVRYGRLCFFFLFAFEK